MLTKAHMGFHACWGRGKALFLNAGSLDRDPNGPIPTLMTSNVVVEWLVQT